jgi:hypothetical protein
MRRTVHCDFCNTPLRERAWDCPARDFDYEGPRASLDPSVHEIVDGSIGSWLACDTCAALIRAGQRDALAERALTTMLARLQIPRAAVMGTVVERDLRALHDGFWAHREGEPVAIGAEQLALIASDPATIRGPNHPAVPRFPG